MNMSFLRAAGASLLLLGTPNPGHAEIINAANSDIEIFWQGEFSPTQQDKLRQWLTQATETMLLLNGQLPSDSFRIELEAVAGSHAVPFARVLRRAPQGVHFFVNPERPLEEFIGDWTAYHELTHLFLPYPGKPDIWFSEGLASYYQNILQYRAGLLTAQQTLGKLRAGFERGRADDQHSDLTLRELSEVMRERRAYMRVYWSGALYFLEVDLALRQAAAGDTDVDSLDDVLRAFTDCCLTTERSSGAKLAQTFDQIANRRLFVPLYERYSRSHAIPDFTAALHAAEMNGLLADPTSAQKLPVE